MASSDTIIVSNPYGYRSTPRPIQTENQAMWRYTNHIDPANLVQGGVHGLPGATMATVPPCTRQAIDNSRA